jgi:predicted trehalose synthase
MKLFGPEEKERALRAAVTVAERAGYPALTPVVLHCARHVSVLLPEHSLIARVMLATRENVEFERREIAVSRFLVTAGAPAVGPLSSMPADPYIVEGLAVSLWPHIAHREGSYDDEDALRRAAQALQRVHTALSAYPGELPSYKLRIEECYAELRGKSGIAALPDEDRAFLIRIYDRLNDELENLDVHVSPIHGDAHLGNVFFTSDGPVWTDFETASVGPREWDAAAIPYLSAFPELDMRVFSVMAPLRSLCVCVWCSALADDPEKRAAAKHHLELLRKDFS